MKLRHVSVALLMAVAFLAGTLVPSTSGQNTTARYLSVSYMKSLPGKDPIAIEQKVWKPVHQAMVNAGNLERWAVYAREFPNGTATEYDYVTVMVFDEFRDLENPYGDFQALFRKVHPNEDPQKLLQQTEESRNLVRGEVLRLIDETAPRK